MNYGADGDGVVAVFVGDDQRLLRDSAYTHYGRVRLVDDGEAEDGTELAGVGDGEGGAFDVFGLELLGAGAFAEIGNAALQAEEVEVSGIFEDRDDEAPVKSNGDAHVDLAVIADIVAFDVGVDDGPLLQGDDGGANEEGHEGEASAMALLEPGFELGAQIDDAGEIHFVHAVHVRAGAAGLDHVLGDQLAHVRHGDEIARIRSGSCWARRGRGGCGLSRRGRGGSRLRRSLALDELHDVLLGDAAAESGAGDLGEADAVFAGDLAD